MLVWELTPELEGILRNFRPLSATENLTPCTEMTLLVARLAGTAATALWRGGLGGAWESLLSRVADTR